MSIKLMSRVWDMDIPQHQKLLLLALADHANDEGVCWPNQETLATRCGKSDRSVRATLRQLEELHLINTVQRGIAGGKGGGRMSNIYYLRLPEETSGKGGLPEVQRRVTGSPLPMNHQEPSLKQDIHRREKFTPPTPQEVNDYIADQGKTIDGEDFCDFYASKGWMVGKNKMKSWQHAANRWAKNNSTKRTRKNEPSRKQQASDFLDQQAREIFGHGSGIQDIPDSEGGIREEIPGLIPIQ